MRVLVTGCGGFLGREIVRQLFARGDQGGVSVVGVSRGLYPELVKLGLQHRQGDLSDRGFTLGAVTGVDAVIHTAAVAGIWGPWEMFHRVNTRATEHVIEACRVNGIPTLVFTSSPSVTFSGDHQSGVDESVPYSNHWMCHYPHTKAIAEEAVIAADCPGELRTCALRPHLIWGEDDPHILPRLLDRARSGRLRIIGDGMNRVDTVHVSNAAAAHLAAVDRLGSEPDVAAGRAYFITQDEPVNCWDWISEVCEAGSVAPPVKRISYRAAHHVGWACESIYRVLGKQTEPPMTRFVAAQMAKDHFFDITAAKTRLGYQPAMSMREGIERLRAAWAAGR